MGPTHQDFGARDPAGLGVDQRLEIGEEPVCVASDQKFGGQAFDGDGLFVHLGGEKRPAPAATPFEIIKHRIGIRYHLFGMRHLGLGNRDADTGRVGHGFAVKLKRRRHVAQDVVRQAADIQCGLSDFFRMMYSSLPMRAITSSGSQSRRSIRAAEISEPSPASWPSESLTDLNRSRSI